MDHFPHGRSAHAPVLGGRYELGALLGRGGMSEVYRAQDRMMQREVAVKVLRANGTDDTMARRMSQEARIVAAVDHPHLVRVYDAGCEDGQCYLVMELVDGGTLGELVNRGPLPAQLAARIGTQLAQALGAIHDAGFVHRDIKPANVLLALPADVADTDGTVGSEDTSGAADVAPLAPVSARLTDFGIARMVDGTRITSTGLMLGTAPYLSPEQVLGTLVGYPSDVYALGLLLLECRTAAQAYPGPAVESAVARLHRQPDVPAALGPAWVALLTAMTARKPADRPKAAQVAARLSDLADGREPAVSDGIVLSDAPHAELVGDLVPARRRVLTLGDRMPGGGSPVHHPRGTHATHADFPATEGTDPRRHPLRGARRLVGAAAAAAAVFTAASLISGGSSPFRSDRPQASQPAHHRSATTSKTPAARSSAKGSAAMNLTGGGGNVRLAAAVAGRGGSVEQAAGTSGVSAAAGSNPSVVGSRPASSTSTSTSTGPAAGASSSQSGSTTASTDAKGNAGSQWAPGGGKGTGNGTGNGNGRGNGNGKGHGAGSGPVNGVPRGVTSAPSTSATNPTSSSGPTSSDPPSSSAPSSSPTSSPTTTSDPAVSTTAPTQDPMASSNSTPSTSATSDATQSGAATSDSSTNGLTTTDLSVSPAGLLP